jgi:N-acetylneuraminate synthase
MPNTQSSIKPFKIGNRLIGPGHPVYIVAELSANHRQDFDEAVRLIEAAKASGADAVKLQTYTPDTMTINCNEDIFRHGKESLWKGKTLYKLYQEAYMPWEWQPKLKNIADGIGLDLFSSAYDPTAVDFLKEIDVPAIKISSFEIVDLPLIRQAAQTGLPLILSTGMASLKEIRQAVAAARNAGCKELALLKCTSAYPTQPEEMNLRSIDHLRQTCQCPCGLSDHTRDILAPVVATALGISIIEKHFTCSRQSKSIDSGFSLEPLEFKAMAESIRTAEKMMGSVHFGPVRGERESFSFRRSLYIVEDIQAKEPFTTDNIRAIRPAGGLPPQELDTIINRRAGHALSKGTPLTWEAIEED